MFTLLRKVGMRIGSKVVCWGINKICKKKLGVDNVAVVKYFNGKKSQPYVALITRDQSVLDSLFKDILKSDDIHPAMALPIPGLRCVVLVDKVFESFSKDVKHFVYFHEQGHCVREGVINVISNIRGKKVGDVPYRNRPSELVADAHAVKVLGMTELQYQVTIERIHQQLGVFTKKFLCQMFDLNGDDGSKYFRMSAKDIEEEMLRSFETSIQDHAKKVVALAKTL